MRRVATLLVLCVLVSACSGSDATVGVPGKDPESVKALTSLVRVDLGTLGGVSSYAADINNVNTVVGWSETPTGATHAFRWTSTTGMIDLGTLPGDESSRAVAILDGGTQNDPQVLGVSTRNGESRAVVWSASGSISLLNAPMLSGFTVALPTDFNARGDIVGSDAGNGMQHGWVLTQNGGKYDLSGNIAGGSNEGSANAVTSSGTVLLTTRAFTCHQSPECWRTYLWRSGTGYVALGTPGNDNEANVTGLGLSETGTVVGWLTSNATAPATAYRWDAGSGFTPLAHYASSGFRYGYAAAANSSGNVVGGDFDPASGAIVASTWLANGSIEKLTPDDHNPSLAVAVNAYGVVAGWAVATGANHAVIWKRATAGVTANLTELTGSKRSVSTPSSRCLADARALSSRSSLFTCIVDADKRQ